MTYYQTKRKYKPNDTAKCDKCHSTTILYQGGSLICRDCGHIIFKRGTRKNKYGAVRTVGKDGIKRDSKFESNVADELYLLKHAGAIKDYESQYKVVLNIYDHEGNVAMTKNWRVDFRVHELDNTFTLYEIKGVELSDYKWKRDILLNVWLKEHPDHTFEVRKQNNYRGKRKKV